MLRVRGDFDAGIRMLKGELSRVRGNLNSDCQGYEAKMTGEMVDICRDEKTAVGPMVNRRLQKLLSHDAVHKDVDALQALQDKEFSIRDEIKLNQQRLSMDVSFLKFKMAVRASHFETAQHALLEDRRLANHDRYALQRQLAPLPRQLQATTSKLEAVELELGGISKELESINADKLDLLTSKVKLSKAIAEIQNEYGFTKEEEGDPRLAGIDRIAELDAQIRSRREELLAAEESVCVCV